MIFQHRQKYQRGAALVEFALVTTAGFIVLLLAVFELGRLLFIFIRRMKRPD
ncbi:MAG: TadE/TadG family type IV pilus assembly protein [Betaproteobacteria bacterium]